MTSNLKDIETRNIEDVAHAYGLKASVDDIEAQRYADINRLATQKTLKQTPEAIRDQLQAMLVLSLEVMSEHYTEERWRTGVVGAILAGRMSMLREILDWMEKVVCSQCGNAVHEGYKFCVQCGAAVALENQDDPLST